MVCLRSVALCAALLTTSLTPAAAGPLYEWRIQGEIANQGARWFPASDDFELGSPVDMRMTIDPSTPNDCTSGTAARIVSSVKAIRLTVGDARYRTSPSGASSTVEINAPDGNCDDLLYEFVVFRAVIPDLFAAVPYEGEDNHWRFLNSLRWEFWWPKPPGVAHPLTIPLDAAFLLESGESAAVSWFVQIETVTVRAVPAPHALILLGCGVVAAACRRYCRR